jgi:hypothetical protein
VRPGEAAYVDRAVPVRNLLLRCMRATNSPPVGKPFDITRISLRWF